MLCYYYLMPCPAIIVNFWQVTPPLSILLEKGTLCPACTYCTILFAQFVLAKDSGFALKTKPMPRIYPMASLSATLDSKLGLVLMSACTSGSTSYFSNRGQSW